MMIGQVQEHLEAIYGIRCDMRVADYLLEERAAAALGGTGRAHEELLIAEEGGALEVGLYLSGPMLSRLHALEGRPLARIVAQEFAAYCQLAEGVSHFLYLAFVADLERRVSLLELEVQAEIDKFATCALTFWADGVNAARQLLERLFVQVRYAEGLSAEERWRYEEANRLARVYCERLLPMIAARQLDRLLSELRYAYRLGAEAKLRHLAERR